MSQKFEQLLDYIVNEEMDKANELFHEIVVEKSRSIYENLIKEEEEQAEEAKHSEEMEESEVEADESISVEDSYGLEEEPMDAMADAADPVDKFGADVMEPDMPDAEMGDDEMSDDDLSADEEEEVAMDIKAAIDALQAAFDKLEGGDMDDEEGDMDDEEGDMDDEEDDEENMEMMGNLPEGRRMTREYVEKVGAAKGPHAGAGTGETVSAPVEGKSPVSSGKGKPTSEVNAKNIVAGDVGEGTNVGTTPGKVSKGITPESGDKFAKGAMDNSAPGAHTKGYKNKVSVAHGEGHAVGAGTGENPVKGATNTKPVLGK